MAETEMGEKDAPRSQAHRQARPPTRPLRRTRRASHRSKPDYADGHRRMQPRGTSITTVHQAFVGNSGRGATGRTLGDWSKSGTPAGPHSNPRSISAAGLTERSAQLKSTCVCRRALSTGLCSQRWRAASHIQRPDIDTYQTPMDVQGVARMRPACPATRI